MHDADSIAVATLLRLIALASHVALGQWSSGGWPRRGIATPALLAPLGAAVLVSLSLACHSTLLWCLRVGGTLGVGKNASVAIDEASNRGEAGRKGLCLRSRG